MARKAPVLALDGLAHDCLEQLRRLPFVQSAELAPKGAKDDPGAAARLVVQAGGRTRTLPCVVEHSHLSRAAAEHLIVMAQRQPTLVVFAPVIGRDLGELFEAAGVNFMDRAGNCHLRLDERHVARVQGRRQARSAPNDRALRAPAYRVLFTLLVRPALIAAPVRQIAKVAGVSPQTASDLKQRLIERGIVARTRAQVLWLPEHRKDALNMFVTGFSASLAPALLIRRYRAAERDVEALEARLEPLLDDSCAWRYGGGAAAMRLTEYYRSDRTTLYVSNPPADLPQRLRLTPDRQGPIALSQPPSDVAFESPHARCVHPLLVYADLLSEHDGRAREAAAEVYARFLEPEPKGR